MKRKMVLKTKPENYSTGGWAFNVDQGYLRRKYWFDKMVLQLHYYYHRFS